MSHHTCALTQALQLIAELGSLSAEGPPVPRGPLHMCVSMCRVWKPSDRRAARLMGHACVVGGKHAPSSTEQAFCRRDAIRVPVVNMLAMLTLSQRTVSKQGDVSTPFSHGRVLKGICKHSCDNGMCFVCVCVFVHTNALLYTENTHYIYICLLGLGNMRIKQYFGYTPPLSLVNFIVGGPCQDFTVLE